MKVIALLLIFGFILSGCVSRTTESTGYEYIPKEGVTCTKLVIGGLIENEYKLQECSDGVEYIQREYTKIKVSVSKEGDN